MDSGYVWSQSHRFKDETTSSYFSSTSERTSACWWESYQMCAAADVGSSVGQVSRILWVREDVWPPSTPGCGSNSLAAQEGWALIGRRAWGRGLSKACFPKMEGRGREGILPPSQLTGSNEVVSHFVLWATLVQDGLKAEEAFMARLGNATDMSGGGQTHAELGLSHQRDFTDRQSGATLWLDLCLWRQRLTAPTSCNHGTRMCVTTITPAPQGQHPLHGGQEQSGQKNSLNPSPEEHFKDNSYDNN